MDKRILLVADSWAWCWYTAETFKSNKFFETFSNANPGDFTRLIASATEPHSTVEADCKIARINLIEILLKIAGHQVTTIAKPGSSVPVILSELYKNKQKLVNIDLVVWVVTDPLRNLFDYHKNKKLKDLGQDMVTVVNKHFSEFESHQQIIEQLHQISKMNYRAISNFSNNYLNSSPVLLAGGAGKVYTHIINELSKKQHFCCEVLCESILQSLTNNKWEQPDLYFTNLPFDQLDLENFSKDIVEFLHQTARNHRTNLQEIIKWQAPDPFHMNANAALFFADMIQEWIEHDKEKA